LYNWLRWGTSRRGVLRAGGLSLIAGALGVARAQTVEDAQGYASAHRTLAGAHGDHGGMITVGEVDHARNGFDPSRALTDWDPGVVSSRGGRRLREFTIRAEDKEIEIAPGLMFPAWTYNGRVPGPTLRVTEGDRVRINFINAGSHPHSMHFLGIQSARMDGVSGAGASSTSSTPFPSAVISITATRCH
jgi:FtsP/CotA-like multicopper oxidase with cupredoxin domain